jgi:tripartite-type tricarboxylate transporter receptor subunit TctC
MKSRRNFLSALAAAPVLIQTSSAQAQSSMPKGPITLVVPFAAGGATDIVSRHIAKKISEKTGISMIVENVAGGGGVVGASRVARCAWR